MVPQESKEPEEVIILLVGDPGVGKTSLILSLVKGEFDPNPPPKIENATLSANVTPDHVPLKIVDYSERDQTNEDLKQLVEKANVICIVYSAGDPNSLERVKAHWVGVLHHHQTGNDDKFKPIIVAANKSDLTSDVKSPSKIPPVLQEFEDIQAFIDVSALTQKNVVELFYLAQKSVLYPLAPLFDSQSRILTKKCRSALINIFKLCDLDDDGLLSDHELNLFHENCFGVPLQKDALDDLKSVIKQSTMDGISDNSITQSGFLFLHTLSIDKGRHSFTWRVLKKFNYDNQINNISELKDSAEETTLDVAGGASILTHNNSSNQCTSSSKLANEDINLINQIDLSWVRENSKMIKAGFGLTVATIISMVALKYLVQGGSKGSV